MIPLVSCFLVFVLSTFSTATLLDLSDVPVVFDRDDIPAVVAPELDDFEPPLTPAQRAAILLDRLFSTFEGIFCFGPLPEIDVSGLLGYPSATSASLAYQSVRQLCVKQSYGGDLRWNAEYYCVTRPDLGRLVISQRRAPSSPSNPIAAILVFCQMRCQCVPPMAMTANEIHSYDTQPLNIRSYPTWEYHADWGFQLDPPRFDVISRGEHVAIGLESLRFSGRTQHLTLPGIFTRARCYGQRPDWNLPAPFDLYSALVEGTPYFININQLCQAGWFGGAPVGNAGGVCKGDEFKFLDYASHPSFLESSGPLGLAVRYWCQSWCKCGEETATETLQRNVIYTVYNGSRVKITFPNGNVIFTPILADGRPSGRRWRLTSASNQRSVQQRLISHSGKSEAASLPQPQQQLEQCGGPCTGPAAQSCPGAFEVGACLCKVLPSQADIIKYGLDFVAPGAICLSMLAIQQQRRRQNLRRPAAAAAGGLLSSLLGKRALPEAVGEGEGEGEEKKQQQQEQALLLAEIESWGCPCNTSYVSKQCCHSADGLIWEGAHLKLGDLLLFAS